MKPPSIEKKYFIIIWLMYTAKKGVLLELRQVPWPSTSWILPTHCKPLPQDGPGLPPQRCPSSASIELCNHKDS